MGNCMNNVGNDAKQLEQATRMDSDDDDIKYPDINQGSKMHNREIEKHMKEQHKRDSEVIKILLLGAGSSGKSTLFRQIECIHGEDNYGNQMGMQADRDVARYFATMPSMKRTIRYNCAGALVKLLQKSDLLSKEPYNLQDCIIDFNNETIQNAIKLVAQFAKNANHENKCDDPEELAQLAEAMDLLWELDGVKATFKHRQYFSLMENIDYFLNKISIIMNETEENRYEPTIEDILNARMQTTGIIERAFIIQKIRFEIFDVGGQRNERRKWIGLFDKVNGLIFVAALNHYCCVLFEDETVNAMQESLQLFDEIVNAKWFTSKHTQFILFLNKDDLFRIRLKDDRIPLKFCFGDEYEGKNYNDKSDEELSKMDGGELEKHFVECYNDSIKFIKNEYLKRNRNHRITSIFIHVTTATEKSNIQKVFDDVRMGIISQSLATSGFHVDMQNVIQQ